MGATGTGVPAEASGVTDHVEVAGWGATAQRLTSNGLAVRLVVAGLPAAVAGLFRKDSAAFLRCAGRIELRPVAVADLEKSFARTFAAAGTDPARTDIPSAS